MLLIYFLWTDLLFQQQRDKRHERTHRIKGINIGPSWRLFIILIHQKAFTFGGKNQRLLIGLLWKTHRFARQRLSINVTNLLPASECGRLQSALLLTSSGGRADGDERPLIRMRFPLGFWQEIGRMPGN